MSHVTRMWATLACLPLVAAGLGVTGHTATASGAERAAPERVAATPYALKTRGYGSKVVGGEVPAGSDTTAFERIGCTNKAGKVKRNHEAEVEVPGLGVASGVTTTLRTTRNDGVVSSSSVQRIASVELAESSVGTLTIEALRSEARTFHNGKGFQAEATTDVGRIVLTPAGGEPEVISVPSANEPVTIPGLAEIKVGRMISTESANGSFAKANALIVRVFESGTKATLGLAQSRMNDGVEKLLFRGHSSGIQATGLEGAASKGRTPLSLMPCQGTLGKVLKKRIAGLDLTDAIEVGTLTSRQRANQTLKQAHGYERGSRREHRLRRRRAGHRGHRRPGQHRSARTARIRFDARGTTVGTITADGEPQTFPDTGILEIPGVARLEAKVDRADQGQSLSVVGVRVTLLDGSGAVIDLGTASIGAKRSGRSAAPVTNPVAAARLDLHRPSEPGARGDALPPGAHVPRDPARTGAPGPDPRACDLPRSTRLPPAAGDGRGGIRRPPRGRAPLRARRRGLRGRAAATRGRRPCSGWPADC